MPGVYVIEDDFSKIGLPLLPLDPRATSGSQSGQEEKVAFTFLQPQN